MKRLLDITLVIISLPLTLPILIVVVIAVKMKLGSPVFFSQTRSGRFGEPFKMIKLRTMTDECDSDGNLLPDTERLTRFGSILRSTSLDELPSLWNVLIGNMSLVGPRPLLMDYLEYYSDEQERRHEVSPGVTGWAQVNGRNAISWEKKFEYDVWYVDNSTLWLDIKILWLTIKKVLVRDGISPQDEAIMPRFDTVMIQRKISNEK